MSSFLHRAAGSFGAALLLPALALADTPAEVDYLRQVKPILARHCYECHNAKVQKGGLRLDTAAALMQGGDGGPTVQPGKAKESLLIEVLSDGGIYPRMPYKRPPLKAKQIQLLTDWVNQGARAPKEEKVADARRHWAFQPPVRPPLPVVKNPAWLRNPIDHFILARLDRAGLTPAPEADRATLIRRVSLDLLGLPPSIEDVDAFRKDRRPDAYERLVERLLNSPHYGERWGRHWLDAARYADSNGFTIDSPREIWKYRDWVIAALNRDMPFDQFVIAQFAGDMLPQATLEQKIATGFHRNTQINQEGGIDPEQFRIEAVSDRVDTTGVVFLGLTLGCAKCHDHKYDPISQREYYQLFAFLNNQSEPTLSIATPELAAVRETIADQIEKAEESLDKQLHTLYDTLSAADRGKQAEEIAGILRLGPTQRTDRQKQALAKFFRPKNAELKKQFDGLEALKKRLPKFPTTMVLQELPRGRETHVLLGGDFTRQGDRIAPGVPAVLHRLPTPPAGRQPTRLDLARWLVDPDNPLVGRVTVNRLWQRYFGTGLVETENDFGTQGSPPTHPLLLDWLATEFIRQNWSLKEMHRLIVTSATYRQSSQARPEAARIDPYNTLLARQNRLRLDAEIIRDNALAVSGLLSPELGGPPVYPPQPDGVYAFTQVRREWKTSTGTERYRRGLYTFFQRSAPYPALTVFDAPNSVSACTRRVRSNTPLQALTLLNDQAFLELARGLADRVLQEKHQDSKERLRQAFRICLAREPSSWEMHRLEQFLQQQLQDFQKSPQQALHFLSGSPTAKGTAPAPLPADGPERAAWTAVTRVLLNLDEFITRE